MKLLDVSSARDVGKIPEETIVIMAMNHLPDPPSSYSNESSVDNGAVRSECLLAALLQV